jgi:hypothetical protein
MRRGPDRGKHRQAAGAVAQVIKKFASGEAQQGLRRGKFKL